MEKRLHTASSGARRLRVWRPWTPQALGLAPKYSRLRLYFGA